MSTSGSGSDRSNPSASFPHTTSLLTFDHDSFVMQWMMTMQATLGGLVKHVDSMDKKLDRVADEVAKHGRWIYAASVVVVLGVSVLGFLVKALWDIATATLGVS